MALTTKLKIADWKERLAKVYNRGFWDGYYLGRQMGEWSNHHGSAATEKKVYLGKGVNILTVLAMVTLIEFTK